MSKQETLLEGASFLERVMASHGFAFELRGEGRGSGGEFAWGEYVSGNRRLELHFRYSLGLVRYHVGAESVSHESYMNELGVRDEADYPGFSDEPLDGFKHLAHDLERFGNDFLCGYGDILRRAARAERARANSESQNDLARYVGDVEKREQAKQRFQAEDWKGVISLLESLRYRDQMSKADEERLKLARRRMGAS